MRRRIANFLRALARWVDPNVYRIDYGWRGPIAQEDVDDFYGGIAPPGRPVLGPETFYPVIGGDVVHDRWPRRP